MYKPIDFALQAVDKGYTVCIACRPAINGSGCLDHGSECTSPGKVALLKHHHATNSADDVKRLWTKDYNILCKTKESNLVVLDLDLKPDKPDGLAWIKRNSFNNKLNTRQHRTGSGGTHYLYRVTPEMNVSHGDRICDGLDLRGTSHHHYVIWIGSRHENGRFYEVIDETEPEILPQWLIDEISQSRGKFNPDIFTTPGETILEQLWIASGLPQLGFSDKYTTNKIWIPCLMEHSHTSGRKAFDCVLMTGQGVGRWGTYVCMHQSHRKIDTRLAVSLLKQRVSPEDYDRIVGKYETNTKSPYNIRTVDDCTSAITELFDSIDNKQGKITVVQVTTGIGKTEGAIRYLGSHGDKPTNYFVPNHKLADEFVERLTARTGIEAAHPKGLTAFKDDEACVFPDMVQQSARLKLPIRQNVCVRCSHFNNYKGTGTGCKAGKSAAAMAGKHRVLQHSTLDAVLRSHDGSGNKLLIVDEQPELITSQELSLKVFESDEVFDVYGMDEGEVRRYRKLASYILNASRIFDGFATARDVVSVGKNGAQILFDFNDKSGELITSIANNELPYPYEAAGNLARQITTGNKNASYKLRQLADAFTILYGLRTACLYPNRETFHFQGGKVTLRVPATWIVEATRYTQSGGNVLLMSASANVDVLRETLGENTEFIQIHAMDAPEVNRVYRYDNRVSRKYLCPNNVPNIHTIRGALNRVYEDLAEEGNIKEVLIVTHKPVAECLRKQLNDVLPMSWIRQLDSGGILHIAHYGAILGIDAFKHVDAVVTLGYAIMNIDVAKAESRALGVREDSYLNFKTQSEQLQAAGRIRACRRKDPALILHVGLRKPDVTIDPAWARFLLPDVA